MATNEIHLRSEIVTHVFSAKAERVLLRAVELGLIVQPNDAFTEWEVRHPTDMHHRGRLVVTAGTTGPRSCSISLRVRGRRGLIRHTHVKFLTEAAALTKLERIAR
jgi:hypothetical protein